MLRVLDLFLARGQLFHAAAVDDVRVVRAEPQRRAHRVHRHVAAADHRDVLVPLDRRVGVRELEGLHQVVARQVLVRAVDAVEVLARDVHEPRQPRADADVDRVEAVFGHQLADRARLADHEVGLELDAELLQVLDLALHDRLGQPELRDAVDEHAAGLVQRLEDRHVVAGLDQVPGADQPAGARAADRDLLAGLLRLRRHRGLALARLPVGDEALEAPDRDRLAASCRRRTCSRTASPAGRRGRRRRAAGSST